MQSSRCQTIIIMLIFIWFTIWILQLNKLSLSNSDINTSHFKQQDYSVSLSMSSMYINSIQYIPIKEYIQYNHLDSTILLFEEINYWLNLNQQTFNKLFIKNNDNNHKIDTILMLIDSYLFEAFMMRFRKFKFVMQYKYNETIPNQNKYILCLIPLSKLTEKRLLKYIQIQHDDFNISSNINNYFIGSSFNIYVATTETDKMSSFSVDHINTKKSHIWYFRLFVLNHFLLSFGDDMIYNLNSIILNDIDAIWIKNTYIFIDYYLKNMDIDIMAGMGNHPTHLSQCSLLAKLDKNVIIQNKIDEESMTEHMKYRMSDFKWFNKIVMGFFYIKCNQKTQIFARNLRKYVIDNYERNARNMQDFDDQICFNCFLVDIYNIIEFIEYDGMYYFKCNDLKNKSDRLNVMYLSRKLVPRKSLPKTGDPSPECTIVSHIHGKLSYAKYGDIHYNNQCIPIL